MVDLAVLGLQLDLMILKLFSNLNDSVILQFDLSAKLKSLILAFIYHLIQETLKDSSLGKKKSHNWTT